MEITPNTLFYLAIVSYCLGIIIGLFLFFYARKKGKQTLGVVGLVISLVSGAIGPLLPILVLLIFIFLIRREAPLSSASEEPGDEPDDNGDRVL